MKNVEMTVEGNILTIKVDLSKSSSSDSFCSILTDLNADTYGSRRRAITLWWRP